MARAYAALFDNRMLLVVVGRLPRRTFAERKSISGAKTKCPDADENQVGNSLFFRRVAAGQTETFINARGEDVRRTETGRRPLRNENPAALADGSVKG